MKVCEDFLCKDLDGSAFVDPGEHVVHGGAVLVVTVWPEVTVGVEGLHGRLVAEPSLDGLDRAAPTDEERGVEVSEVVERRPLGEFRLPGRPMPHLAGRAPPERRGVAAREDEVR